MQTTPRKRRAHEVDEDMNEAVRIRKEQNRIAAQRSRQARKQREHEEELRLERLEERNRYLKSVVAQVSAEVQHIKMMMCELMQARPSSI
jgi:Skp family chaperone for outer membrane proteins